jgi:acetylornithine deacetylase
MDPLDHAVALLGDLIAFPSISRDGNLEIAAWLSAALGDLGAQTRMTVDETGHKANLFATFGPEGDGGVMLSAHTDVVPVDGQEWTSDPFAMVERDGALYGRGACDMKGFIACVLAMAPRFAEAELVRPVHVALTYDEEVGCFGARAMAEALTKDGPHPALAIVGEPTLMRMVDAHKGCWEYTTRFTGREGHGSRPDLGANAAIAAARYAAKLAELAEALRARAAPDSPFAPPWTTVNLGRIEGGAVHNMIPGACVVDWEMRPVREADGRWLLEAIDAFAEGALLPALHAAAPEAAIIRETVAEAAALEPRSMNAARDLVAALTGANGTEAVSFGTEAGFWQELGMDVVICGPGSIEQAHKPDEWVSRDQLAQCLAMLERLVVRLSR